MRVRIVAVVDSLSLSRWAAARGGCRPGSAGSRGLPERDGLTRHSYLVLRGNTDPVVGEWANEIRPYLRMGIHTERFVPAEEFDALLYIDHVGPPDYEIP